MVKKINFRNTADKSIEVFVEPDAEMFELPANKEIIIEVESLRPIYTDNFGFEFDGNSLTIYQPRQSDLKIYIGKELVFYSLPGRPML